MHAIKSLMVAAGVALSLASCKPAQAANVYAAVIICNDTSATIYYQFRWRTDREWYICSIGPYQVRKHEWPDASADETRAPRPQILFRSNPGEPLPVYKMYTLEADTIPSPVVGWGNRYVFRFDASGRYLDLYKE